MDPTSKVKLQSVYPGLADKVVAADAAFQQQNAGDSLEVVQGFRSWQEQLRLWLKGRDAQGNIVAPALVVTNAPPGHSWHEFGLAVDVVPRSLLVIRGWKPDSPLWQLIEQIAEQNGLVSGFCWHHQDMPHLQLTGRFGVSPDDEARQILQSGGPQAVWKAAFGIG